MASKKAALTFRLTQAARDGLVALGEGTSTSENTEFYVSLGHGVREFMLIWAKPRQHRTEEEQQYFAQIASEIIAALDAADEEGNPVSLQFE